MIYDNVNDVLADVAGRSFYEDCTVTPLIPVRGTVPVAWLVEDERGAHMSDEWEWTDEDGLRDTDSVSECSRLMDAGETFDAASHIRFHLPESVEMLEDGTGAVTFAYAVVYNLESDSDETAGWILAANHWEESL